MSIRTSEPPEAFIHYTDVLSLKGVGESRAKVIFAEIAHANNLGPYEPRTMKHYRIWEKWKAMKRIERRLKRTQKD